MAPGTFAPAVVTTPPAEFLFFGVFFAELAQIVVIRYPRAPSVVSLSKTLCPRNLVLVSNQEDSA